MRVIQVVVQTPTPPPLPEVPFDPNFFVGSVVPLIGVVALAVAAAFVLKWFFGSPIGEAIAEGIRQRRRRRGAAGELIGEPERVVALEEEMTRLHGQMSELAERLDFAERMLAERRERQLGAGQ
ncbi:MAG TPA: hypothetical protein VGA20_07250 [Gemmatimonadales bacterium]